MFLLFKRWLLKSLRMSLIVYLTFLIVNDTNYHETVPVLIGTKILSVLLSDTKQKFGVRFLQKAKLHTPWYLAFRCMTLRERELSRRSYVLALVRSAEERPITLPPNLMHVEARYHSISHRLLYF